MDDLGFHFWTIITVGSLVTFIVASLSYYVMERQILKLKKRFSHATPNSSYQFGLLNTHQLDLLHKTADFPKRGT
jgi:peptidoglycan/LPS O-acetylase OafA/YrhL